MLKEYGDVSTDDQARAVEQLEAHQRVLTAALHAAEIAPFIAECESLISGVKAFNMEAILFRIFNLQSYLARGGQAVPFAAITLFNEARFALEVVGVKTK